MTTEAILKEASHLTLDERIKLVEELWESIRPSAESIPLNEAQEAVLERRYKAYQADPEEGSSWSDVRDRISNR